MILKIARSGIVNIRLTILLFILGLSSIPGASQSFNSINLHNIPQARVRKYIVSRSIDKTDNFSSIHASWKKDNNLSDYNFIEKIFYLKYSLSNVWTTYLHSNPLNMWNGQCVRLGLMISKSTNTVSYINNYSFPQIDTGQVYFLDLRLMKGLLNVPVAFEIIKIDPRQRVIEFSYIDNNVSQGKQTIQFIDNGDGNTKIVHRSYFKSESPLRDDVFYPYFHKRLINEFHRNMKQLIKRKKFSAINPN